MRESKGRLRHRKPRGNPFCCLSKHSGRHGAFHEIQRGSHDRRREAFGNLSPLGCNRMLNVEPRRKHSGDNFGARDADQTLQHTVRWKGVRSPTWQRTSTNQALSLRLGIWRLFILLLQQELNSHLQDTADSGVKPSPDPRWGGKNSKREPRSYYQPKWQYAKLLFSPVQCGRLRR